MIPATTAGDWPPTIVISPDVLGHARGSVETVVTMHGDGGPVVYRVTGWDGRTHALVLTKVEGGA